MLGPVVKLCTSNAGEKSLIPGGGTRMPHAAQCGQKKKKKREYLLIAYLVKAQTVKIIIFVPRIIINNEIIQSKNF